MLPERCGECHRSALEVWDDTPHATGFETLHRSDRAKEIYSRLGLRLIKRGTEETTPVCLQCHYTPVLRREALRAGAGVSCESCHGPAGEWIEIHNDYGVSEPDFQRAALLETPEHRAERIERSRAAGMRRPSELYDVVANCFGCHTVPNEELVNRAGHSTGSDFELVAWSQGQIRHNFLESYKTGDGNTNAERPPERKRVMHVVGRVLDLEYSLRGVARATVDDLYLGAMSDRAGLAADNLLEIAELAAVPEIEAILAVFDSVELKTNNRVALERAADQIGELARQFIARASGSDLAGLDPLWDPDAVRPARLARADPPTPREPGATAPITVPPPETESDAADDSAARAEGLDTTVPVAVADPPPATATATPPAPDIRTRPAWREEPRHPYVRKVPYARCHNAQEKWWRQDPHSQTARPFRATDTAYQEVARAYGLGVAEMTKGDQICMWCHGTVVGNPSRDVRFGVGCQRCHGPGQDYEAPHEDSYQAALTLGLVDLKDAGVRAGTCAGCHYITDAGLIAAGHATGSDFDLVDGVAAIKHWGDGFGGTARDIPPVALAAAHDAVLVERGPAPVPSRIAAAAQAAGQTTPAVQDRGPATRAGDPRGAAAGGQPAGGQPAASLPLASLSQAGAPIPSPARPAPGVRIQRRVSLRRRKTAPTLRHPMPRPRSRRSCSVYKSVSSGFTSRFATSLARRPGQRWRQTRFFGGSSSIAIGGARSRQRAAPPRSRKGCPPKSSSDTRSFAPTTRVCSSGSVRTSRWPHGRPTRSCSRRGATSTWRSMW